MRCWGKEGTLIGEPADWEDGRLVSQINHLTGVWMPGCFIDKRERTKEELKSKGRRRGRFSGEVKWESLQSWKTFPREWKPFWRGILLLSPGGQGQIISPWAEQRDFSLRSGRGIGTSKQAIEYDYIVSEVMKSKSKKQFSTWSQNWLSSSNKMKEPHFTFPGNRHGQ